MNEKKPKRAIALAGRGPAAGLHIGALRYLKKAGIEFDVWAVSNIGAWVAIVYNQADKGREVEEVYEFFRNHVFRDDASYQGFPLNAMSTPDWRGSTGALTRFLRKPENYQHLVSPDELMESFEHGMSLLSGKRRKRDEGDRNRWVLNNVLAVNPFARLWMSMISNSNIDGLFKTYYPASAFIKQIKFERLYEEGKPYIFYNAWNLSKQKLQFFSNKNGAYKPITAASMCACSALPLLDSTVEIDGDAYCEGTLVDTMNFETLLHDHPDLDEVWIVRNGDAERYRKPENLHDALGNLTQQYEATLGENDVKLFKYHVAQDDSWRGRIVEIQINSDFNHEWSHGNLQSGQTLGYRAATKAHMAYSASKESSYSAKSRIEEKKQPDGEKELKSLEAAETVPDVGSKRSLNAWIDDPEPKVGKPFKVSINIGAPKDSAEASVHFVEPDWHGIDFMDLLVAVSSIDCEVDPSWQRLTLPRKGDSETIIFKVTANVPGNHEFSIRVYLERQMILVQSLSFSVAVTKAGANSEDEVQS